MVQYNIELKSWEIWRSVELWKASLAGLQNTACSNQNRRQGAGRKRGILGEQAPLSAFPNASMPGCRRSQV